MSVPACVCTRACPHGSGSVCLHGWNHEHTRVQACTRVHAHAKVHACAGRACTAARGQARLCQNPAPTRGREHHGRASATPGVQTPACAPHERARAARARTRPRVCVCWVPARRRLAAGREALAGPAAGGGGGKCGSDSAAPANTCKQLRAHNGKYRWGTAPPIASDSRLPKAGPATATSTGTPLGAAFPAAPHFFLLLFIFFSPPFFFFPILAFPR